MSLISVLKKVGGTALNVATDILTGGAPAGVAVVRSMITEVTGTSNMREAEEVFKQDPDAALKLQELMNQEQASIREHHREALRLQLEDEQKEHEEQQKTIRTGDAINDPYIRKTRPLIARQSWWGTLAYIVLFEAGAAFNYGPGADWTLASAIAAPCFAYFGFRTADKIFKKGEKK